MFTVLAATKKYKAHSAIQDVIDHRMDFIRSEGVEDALHPGWDDLDTAQTTYLVQDHSPYGIIGSARLVPPSKLHPDLKAVLPDVKDPAPFILADCYFHIPENSEVYNLPDGIRSRHFQHLLRQFYKNLMVSLENKAIQEQTPVVYGFLNEEDFEFLNRYGGRSVAYNLEFDQGLEAQGLIFCHIDMSNLMSIN